MQRPVTTFPAAATLLAFAALPVLGQPRGPRPMMATQRLEELKKDLLLTKLQVEKIKVLFQNQEKEMQKELGPLPQEGGRQPMGPPPGDPEEMRTKMVKRESELDKKILELLTREQQEKYTKLIKERRARPRPMPPPEGF